MSTRRFLLRAAALLPVAALAGCNYVEDLFESSKPALPGKREARAGRHARPAGGPGVQDGGQPAAAGAERGVGAIRRQPGAPDGQRPARRHAAGVAALHRRGRRLPAEDHRDPGHRRRPGVHHGLRRRRRGVRPGHRQPALDHRHGAQEGPQHQCRRRAGRGRRHGLRHHRPGRGAGHGRPQRQDRLAQPAGHAGPLGADRCRQPAVRHHARQPHAGARPGGRQAAVELPGHQRRHQRAGRAGAGLLGRPGGRRLRLRRPGDAARRHRHPGLERQPGRRTRAQQPGRPVRHPWPAGDRGQRRVRHRRRRAAAGARPALRPPPVGARGGGRAHALGRRRLAVRADAGPGAGLPEQGGRPGALAEPAAALRQRGAARATRSSGPGRSSADSICTVPGRPRS